MYDVIDPELRTPYNLQSDCQLFTYLPPEIRQIVFSLALTAYDDGQPYPKGTFYDRPGYHYRHRIDTELLRTCYRAYLECFHLPVELNEITRWCDRGPPHYKGDELDFGSLTQEQMTLRRYHFFTQQLWLESEWLILTNTYNFNPRLIHITIRHTDWWDWEHGRPLHLDPKQEWQASKPFRGENDPFCENSWGNAFRDLHGLKQFVLELETVEGKRAKLDEIVARAAGWRFPLGDGNILVLNESKTKYSAWKGLDRFRHNRSEADFPHTDTSEGDIEPYETPQLKPKIVEMAEDFLESEEAGEELNTLGNCGADTSDSGVPDDVGSASAIAQAQSANAEESQGHDGAAAAHGSVSQTSPRSAHGSKPMTCAIARQIIADVGNIRGFRPSELARIYGYVDTGLTEEEVNARAFREMEDMLALQYYVVSLTWVAKRNVAKVP